MIIAGRIVARPALSLWRACLLTPGEVAQGLGITVRFLAVICAVDVYLTTTPVDPIGHHARGRWPQ